MLREHTEEYEYLPAEQLALRRRRRGCLDAVLVDSMLGTEARTGRGAISVAWIDYKKAFDRVSHGWLTTMLKVINAPTAVRRCTCISNLLPKWKSDFSLGPGKNKCTAEIGYKRGLFQGDALSPLLFCLCLAPLLVELRKSAGYDCVALGSPVTHQLFMDNLKIYSQGRRELSSAVNVVERVSKAIGMEFGLRKCAVAHMVGQDIHVEDHILPEERVIGSLTHMEMCTVTWASNNCSNPP